MVLGWICGWGLHASPLVGAVFDAVEEEAGVAAVCADDAVGIAQGSEGAVGCLGEPAEGLHLRAVGFSSFDDGGDAAVVGGEVALVAVVPVADAVGVGVLRVVVGSVEVEEGVFFDEDGCDDFEGVGGGGTVGVDFGLRGEVAELHGVPCGEDVVVELAVAACLGFVEFTCG